jgi:hypothetical protein
MPRTLIVIYDIFYANITQNRHGGAAWTLPPVKPVVESSPADPSQSLSFAAIQKLQLDEAFMPGNDKRSLLEIQEEQQARQAEDDFLRWWAAEEERMKLESQAAHVPSFHQGGQGKGSRTPKGPRKKAPAKNTPSAGVVNGAQTEAFSPGGNVRY